MMDIRIVCLMHFCTEMTRCALGGGGSYKAINIKTILSTTDLLSCCYRYKQCCYDLHITAPLNKKKSVFKISFSDYFTFFTRSLFIEG